MKATHIDTGISTSIILRSWVVMADIDRLASTDSANGEVVDALKEMRDYLLTVIHRKERENGRDKDV